MIELWSWRTAPDELRQYSHHGGDEDWVIRIPAETVAEGDHPFVYEVNGNDYNQQWGHANVTALDNGDVVIVFAHA